MPHHTSSATCLVTGCAGFVGLHLTRALLDLGFPGLTVIGMDDLSAGNPDAVAELQRRPGFLFLRRDLREPDLLDAVEGLSGVTAPCTHVFHLAARISVAESLTAPEETFAINTEASLALLDAARSRAAAFVFAGSAAEYGESGSEAVRESDASDDTVQLSPYGRSKYLVSREILRGGHGVSLRFFNIYGPGQRPDSPYSGVISRFAALGLADQPMTIFGDGGQTRDFLSVRDAVCAYLLAAGLDQTSDNPLPSGVYNVGSGRPSSINQLAELLGRLTGSHTPPAHQPDRAGDIRHSLADTTALTAHGFICRTSLEDGLAETVEWLRVAGNMG